MSRKTKEEREAIKAAIQATADKSGTVTPDGVVAAAQDPDNPLHSEFEWNDSIAAHQHRLAVARALIREITYVGQDVTGRPVTAVAYVHEPASKKQSYIPLTSAARNKSLARQILLEELGRCEGALRRANEVASVLKIETPLKALLQSVLDLQQKMQSTPPPNKRAA